MPKFTVRVELHEANEDDYDRLHASMEGHGFLRTIEASDGKRYHLPTAEYNYADSLNIDQVLNLAAGVARATGRAFEILVTESNGRKWLNLVPDR